MWSIIFSLCLLGANIIANSSWKWHISPALNRNSWCTGCHANSSIITEVHDEDSPNLSAEAPLRKDSLFQGKWISWALDIFSKASFMEAENLPLSQEVDANQKHLWMWVHSKCTPQIKVNSCDAPERGWSTSVRKSISIHQGIMRTVEELNEILIHFIHSLNRSGNYNLPNTRLRSGEKKTHSSPLKSPIQWERQTKTDDYAHIMSWAIPSTSLQLEWLRRDLTETDHQLTPDIYSPLHFSGRILPL